MHNKKILSDDELTFKLVVKRSDLQKAEDLFDKGKINKVTFDRKDEWSTCYTMLSKEKTTEGPNTYSFHVWPQDWGYLGHKDGWILYGELPTILNRSVELGGEIQTMSLNNYTLTIEIDEN